MKSNSSRIVRLILINIIGVVFLLLPLAGAVVSLKRGQWGFALLSVFLFFVLKQLLFVVEDWLGVRSRANPNSKSEGSGVTIVAPWLRRKFEKTKTDCNDSNTRNK